MAWKARGKGEGRRKKGMYWTGTSGENVKVKAHHPSPRTLGIKAQRVLCIQR